MSSDTHPSDERETDGELGRMGVVAVFFDPTQAVIAKDLLDEARIPTLVSGANASTMFGGTIGQRILAPVSRIAEAQRLLRENDLAQGGGIPEPAEPNGERIEPVHAGSERTWADLLLVLLGLLIVAGVVVLLREYL